MTCRPTLFTWMLIACVNFSVATVTAQRMPAQGDDPFAGIRLTELEPASSEPTNSVSKTSAPVADASATRIQTTAGDGREPIRLIACHDCGNPAHACACSVAQQTGSGEAVSADAFIVDGSSEVLTAPGSTCAACEYSNPYWCNPYGAVYLDPCSRQDCADCQSSSSILWYATVDIVPLTRDQQDDLAFQRLGQAGEVVLETGDFETEFDAGAKLTLGAALTDLFRLEATYLGAYEWSDRASVRNLDPNTGGGVGDLFGPFSNFGTPTPQLGTDFNNFASIAMSGKFNSGEINLRRRLVLPRLRSDEINSTCVANSLLVGFRRINLDEQFAYVSSSTLPAGGTINRANIATENELTGIQIGLLSQFLVRNGQGWVDFEIKGGVYENETRLRSAFESTTQAGAPLSLFNGTDQRDRTAFLGELSLTYNRQVTRRFSYRLGYNAFWLTGVALASENMNTDINLLSLGPAQVDHDSDLVLHGPTLGLTWAY